MRLLPHRISCASSPLISPSLLPSLLRPRLLPSLLRRSALASSSPPHAAVASSSALPPSPPPLRSAAASSHRPSPASRASSLVLGSSVAKFKSKAKAGHIGAPAMGGEKESLDLTDRNTSLPAATTALSAEDRANLVNTLKDKLQSLAGQHADMLETLLPNVRKRVEFLRGMQVD